MNSVGELPQLVDRKLELLLRSREKRGAALGRSLQLVAGFVQPVGERREALLRAVVEVPLEAPAFGIRGVDEPGARSPQSRCERLTLGDDRGETECRQRGNTDEELRRQDAARDRVEVEGALRSWWCSRP